MCSLVPSTILTFQHLRVHVACSSKCVIDLGIYLCYICLYQHQRKIAEVEFSVLPSESMWGLTDAWHTLHAWEARLQVLHSLCNLVNVAGIPSCWERSLKHRHSCQCTCTVAHPQGERAKIGRAHLSDSVCRRCGLLHHTKCLHLAKVVLFFQI